MNGTDRYLLGFKQGASSVSEEALFCHKSVERMSSTNVTGRNALDNFQSLRFLSGQVKFLFVGGIDSEEWFVLLLLGLKSFLCELHVALLSRFSVAGLPNGRTYAGMILTCRKNVKSRHEDVRLHLPSGKAACAVLLLTVVLHWPRVCTHRQSLVT